MSVREVSERDFDKAIGEAQGLVIVDFSAQWCGPCKRLAPELEGAAQDLDGKATVLKVDVDEAPNVAMRYGVQGIPNITFLKNSQVIDVVVGLMPKAAIVARALKNI